jgi:hypothetical protein
MEADVGLPLNQHWSQMILASEPETMVVSRQVV